MVGTPLQQAVSRRNQGELQSRLGSTHAGRPRSGQPVFENLIGAGAMRPKPEVSKGSMIGSRRGGSGKLGNDARRQCSRLSERARRKGCTDGHR
jgi:hypothetical protein